jgi:hypothetical protein
MVHVWEGRVIVRQVCRVCIAKRGMSIAI